MNAHREMEATPNTRTTLDPQAAAHHCHQARGDGEAESGAAETAGHAAIGLRERLEDMLLFVCGDAEARIADRELDHRILRFRLPQAGLDANAAVLGELD